MVADAHVVSACDNVWKYQSQHVAVGCEMAGKARAFVAGDVCARTNANASHDAAFGLHPDCGTCRCSHCSGSSGDDFDGVHVDPAPFLRDCNRVCARHERHVADCFEGPSRTGCGKRFAAQRSINDHVVSLKAPSVVPDADAVISCSHVWK